MRVAEGARDRDLIGRTAQELLHSRMRGEGGVRHVPREVRRELDLGLQPHAATIEQVDARLEGGVQVRSTHELGHELANEELIVAFDDEAHEGGHHRLVAHVEGVHDFGQREQLVGIGHCERLGAFEQIASGLV